MYIFKRKPETQRASRKLGKVDFSTIEHMGLNENVLECHLRQLKQWQQ